MYLAMPLAVSAPHCTALHCCAPFLPVAGRLPDVFYVTPEPEKPKAKARGKKRGRTASGAPAAGLGQPASRPGHLGQLILQPAPNTGPLALLMALPVSWILVFR